ncbi:MAG TPA: M48 family metalloprotease [Fimbriimonadaceae bacterium]|nr:M48 family metalloprotease [Fimbriimonadaceae bacterium]
MQLMTPPPSSTWQKPLGPVDRTTFEAEQALRRRQARRLSRATWGVAAVDLGLTSIIVTPMALLLVILLSNLAAKLFPPFGLAAEAVEAFYTWVFSDKPTPYHVLGAVGLLMIPGIAGTFVLMPLARQIFGSIGARAWALGLGARELNDLDFEEKQAQNLVDEMAIACGLAGAPVMILDAERPNAFPVGLDERDFVIVVTRGLLDELDREKSQGVVAHAVATVANGDLRLTLSIRTMYMAIGLMTTLFDFVLTKEARKTSVELIKFACTSRAKRSAETAMLLAERLVARSGTKALEEVTEAQRESTGQVLRYMFLGWIILPLMIARAFGSLVLLMINLFLVGPFFGVTMQKRKRLADATAVQLTRNPQAVAEGLMTFAQGYEPLAQDPWIEIIAVVGPDWQSQSALAERLGSLGTFHPTLNSRLGRLIAMGAQIDYRPRREASPYWGLGCGVLVLLSILTYVVWAAVQA